MNTLHFVRPLWLLALPLVPLFVWWAATRRDSPAWSRIMDPLLLDSLLIRSGRSAGSTWPRWLMSLCGVLAVMALAGPTWKQLPQPVFRSDQALVLLLDLSRSMNSVDLPPSRLQRARLKISDVLRDTEGQVGLVVFSGHSFVVSPLTDDAATIEAMVSSLDSGIMPSQGSKLGPALELAASLLTGAGARKGDVLVVTDGAGAEAAETAADLLRQGYRTSVLGVGTPEGAPVRLDAGVLLRDARGAVVVPRLEETSLRAVADAGGGQYQRIRTDGSDLDALLGGMQNAFTGARETGSELQTDLWREEGPWLLLALLPLVALGFRRGALACVAILLLPPQPASALEWQDLWSRPDQRGAEAFDRQDPVTAASEFDDPEWRAAAQYRAGDYAASADTLASLATPRAHYNRGNALVRSQQIQAAIEAYQSALALDPQHADARYNLELLLDAQSSQQQEQDGSSGEQDQQQAQNQDSQSGDDQEQTSSGEGSPENDQSQQSSSGDAGEDAQMAESQSEPQPGEEGEETDDQDASDQARDGEDAEQAGKESDMQAQADSDDRSEQESLQSNEQWLRRIPDDPGGLLRRKFRSQYRRQYGTPPQEEQPW